MFVTYKHTNIQTYKHTYIQTLWLLESLDLLDRETKKSFKNSDHRKINRQFSHKTSRGQTPVPHQGLHCPRQRPPHPHHRPRWVLDVSHCMLHVRLPDGFMDCLNNSLSGSAPWNSQHQQGLGTPNLCPRQSWSWKFLEHFATEMSENHHQIN